MKFSKPIEFELPDEWWIDAGMSHFRPTDTAYTSNAGSEWPTAVIRISEIAPPHRAVGVQWFDQGRMTAVLKGIATGAAIPPIEVHELPSPNEFRYELRDGFHRFYAASAAGFEYVTAEVRPYFNVRAFLKEGTW